MAFARARESTLSPMTGRVIKRINDDGPMPFDEYMEICLYDPDGAFFTTGPVRSGKHDVIGSSIRAGPPVQLRASSISACSSRLRRGRMHSYEFDHPPSTLLRQHCADVVA